MQNSKLFVGNLDYSVQFHEIKELFANFGEVAFVKIIEGKGFGFVEMVNQSEAEAAKAALNGSEFKGRNLNVDNAKPQANNGGGGNRDRDFSRGPRDRY